MGELLTKSVTVTATLTGGATATLGPDSGKGPAGWRITRYVVRNDVAARRGAPPIPTCNVYAPGGTENPDDLLDCTYDGSFDAGDCDVSLSRGQAFLAVWAGAQAGDRLTLSLTGEVIVNGRVS